MKHGESDVEQQISIQWNYFWKIEEALTEIVIFQYKWIG